VRAPAAVAALVQACLEQAHRQADEGNYASANRFEEAAQKASLKTANGDYVARVNTEVQRLNELEKLAPLALVARDTLKSRPEEPEANTTVGRYLCFAKAQWVEGLPLLAKGKDLALKGLAERDKEATGQTNPTMFALLADDWWQYGESHPGLEQPGSRQRACLWYAKALPLLSSGLLKQTVQKRLNEQKNDVLALRPQVIHVQVKLTGRHQIDINTAYAQYSHTCVDMPKTVSFAGIDWHPAEEPKIMNMGVNLFLSADADLTSARVNKIRGRTEVMVKDKSASNVTIVIDDSDVTPDTYEFDVLFD